jgi:hypothetical protein
LGIIIASFALFHRLREPEIALAVVGRKNLLREAYAREGRNALFVLPSYQLALTLPTEARVLAMDFNWATKSEVQDPHYAGPVPVMFLFYCRTPLSMRRVEHRTQVRVPRFFPHLRIMLPIPGRERASRT